MRPACSPHPRRLSIPPPRRARQSGRRTDERLGHCPDKRLGRRTVRRGCPEDGDWRAWRRCRLRWRRLCGRGGHRRRLHRRRSHRLFFHWRLCRRSRRQGGQKERLNGRHPGTQQHAVRIPGRQSIVGVLPGGLCRTDLLRCRHRHSGHRRTGGGQVLRRPVHRRRSWTGLRGPFAGRHGPVLGRLRFPREQGKDLLARSDRAAVLRLRDRVLR